MNIKAFFKITYGLYIIATKVGDKLNGYVANTAFQVTADPPQIAISCSKNNHTSEMIQNSRFFSISILNQNAKSETIGLFGYQSGKDINKFKNINYITGSTGSPIVTDDCIAWFDCKVNNIMDVGSHILFIATIENSELLDEEATPLSYAYYQAVKKGKAPKNAPTYIDETNLKEKSSSESSLKKHKCLACGYIYDPAIGDPENDIPPGTLFNDLPEDWSCPTCSSPKDMFDLFE